jgi:RNA recognition motif-containing protein
MVGGMTMEETYSKTNLYISGLAPTVTDEELTHMFAEYVGCATLCPKRSAWNARASINSSSEPIMNGGVSSHACVLAQSCRLVSCAAVIPNGTLSIACLCRHGTIVSVKAVMDHVTNQCKGYGFVLFEKPGSAQRAVAAMKDKDVMCTFAKVCAIEIPGPVL